MGIVNMLDNSNNIDFCDEEEK